VGASCGALRAERRACSFFLVGVPTRIGSTPVLPDKDVHHSACAQFSLAVNLGCEDIAAPNDGPIAKVLHFGARKLKPSQPSPLGVKCSRGSQYIGLIFSFFLAAAHDDRFGRYQFLERLCVSGEPCAPNRLASTQ
jgi:hypothetical protein